MKRLASEVIHNLEMRVARLERKSSRESTRTAKVTSSDLKQWFSQRPKKVRVETQNGTKVKLKDVGNLKSVNLSVYGIYGPGDESLLMVHIDKRGRLQKGWDGGLSLG